ncbi:MAG: hypothetical protein K8Q91_01910 [Candidatus Vogelbacteria bacterium]|nr:hypothetical protein [Candidatus Vogelbacteria bacterium]
MLLNSAEIHTLKDSVYSTISEIKKELKRRQTDEILKKKTADLLGEWYTEKFNNEPKAVFSRSIFTPNLEFQYFMDLVKTTNLSPLLLEYDGKFVGKNLEKYHLCKLYFADGIGKKYGTNYSTKRIVDFNKYEGYKFGEVKTVWGESLVDFHHKLLKEEYPEIKDCHIFDFYDWFNDTRYLTNHYYFYFLSMFIYQGVLFDNFLIEDNEEAKFIKDHLLSSFKEVSDYFGVKPLIYPLLPLENEKSINWLSYSPGIKKNIEQYIIDGAYEL